MQGSINSGDTAWMLVSTALVLVMFPGLALFYGGLVRRKNVLSTFMHTFIALAVISLQWTLFGYSLAFGPDVGGGLIGNLQYAFLRGVDLNPYPHTQIPHALFMVYQMMFAAITPALISGSIAERISLRAYIVFILLWSTLVYDPVAHWLWHDAGWLKLRGALDFAGGVVVHVTSGLSALVFAIVMGKRLGYPKDKPMPHDLTMTVVGAGLLWFGWFGFNGGSSGGANGVGVVAVINSQLAASAGATTWFLLDYLRLRKGSSLGFASGFVAGLATVTPTAGYVGPMSAIVIGLLAGMACYGGVLLKERHHYDDTLDAFGVHGVGGLVGTVLLGIFASKAWNADGADGALITHGFGFLGVQTLAAVAVLVYSVAVTWILLKVLNATIGLRVAPEAEDDGLDLSLHGEAAYADATFHTAP